jgi:hypothetical protein
MGSYMVLFWLLFHYHYIIFYGLKIPLLELYGCCKHGYFWRITEEIDSSVSSSNEILNGARVKTKNRVFCPVKEIKDILYYTPVILRMKKLKRPIMETKVNRILPTPHAQTGRV